MTAGRRAVNLSAVMSESPASSSDIAAAHRSPVGPVAVWVAIQFAHDGAVPGLDKVHLHVRCFAV